uniref:Uncharacterized protein TCIL3000_9_1450 n=1 Tax=Trypanosoma congolense (strain IL3000) TaxID=1068625 RepID=G0UTN4_TRYCI|nr:unnamed protein product [Trypanosoma congolense IL3000]
MSLRGIPFEDALLDVDVNNNSQRNPPRGPRRGKFRLSSPTGEQNPSPSSPYHGKENTDTSYPLPKSVEKHLQDLKHFLTPSAPGEIDDQEAFATGGACEDANHLLNVPTQFQQNTENDERQRPLRVGPTASLAVPQVSVGEEKAQSPSQQPGGFRAPSPMILSLRNLAAYRQRLQAFARKKEKFNSRGRDKGASGTAALYDDDGSRS